jgi:hypothetical protein
MVLHAIGAEPPLEQIDNAAVLELARLHLDEIVREREETEARISQLAQRGGNLSRAAWWRTSPSAPSCPCRQS